MCGITGVLLSGASAGVLEESPLIAAGLISGEVARPFDDGHFGRRRDRGGILWALFCLTLRHRRWLLGERSFPS